MPYRFCNPTEQTSGTRDVMFFGEYFSLAKPVFEAIRAEVKKRGSPTACFINRDGRVGWMRTPEDRGVTSGLAIPGIMGAVETYFNGQWRLATVEEEKQARQAEADAKTAEEKRLTETSNRAFIQFGNAAIQAAAAAAVSVPSETPKKK